MNELLAGRYRVLEPIGGGGTALVYRAETKEGVAVAVKQLRPQFAGDAALRRRFIAEAEVAGKLDHLGIVQQLDAGEQDGVPFIVLELVRGETLRQVLDREHRLEIERARSIFVWLARALDHAHGRGVIHRDVKPQNIFVTPDGVKLGDFGNARVVSLASVTGASLTWGTPEYVAPEVFVRGRADPRSDLYSLGVVFYEMLTGRLPWSRSEALTRLGGGTGASASFAPTGYGEHIDRLLGGMLAFAPHDRPASGEEATARFERFTIVATTTCSRCGAPRADDLPTCLSCAQRVPIFTHDPHADWRLVLRSLPDDAAQIERLLNVLGSVADQPERAPLFLTGDSSLYSDEEISSGVAIPAVLLSHLAESTARELVTAFRECGLDVVAMPGSHEYWVKPSAHPGKVLRNVIGLSVFAGLAATSITGWLSAGAVVAAGLIGACTVAFRVNRRRRLRSAPGIARLRRQIETTPAADRLLAAAVAAVGEVRSTDVRELLADVATELFRLVRHTDALAAKHRGPSSELDLLRSMVAAGPGLVERLRRMAGRLDDLDDALAGPSEGELMQAMARLERAAAASNADRTGLAETRRDLHASVERRHAAEQERARLSAMLCQLLGRMRLIYQRAAATETPDAEQAHAIEAAAAELDALLAAPAA